MTILGNIEEVTIWNCGSEFRYNDEIEDYNLDKDEHIVDAVVGWNTIVETF